MIRGFWLLLVVGLFAPFGAQTSAVHGQTITEIVLTSGGEFDENNGDFDILLTAVLAAGLEGALGDEAATLTVFAPKDIAFIRLAQDLGFEGDDEEGAWDFIVAALTDGFGDPIPVLTNILLYHVAPGNISFFGIIIRSIFGVEIEPLLEGTTITPFFTRLIDNDPDLANARIRWPFNISASNGRIHSINRVLIPIDL